MNAFSEGASVRLLSRAVLSVRFQLLGAILVAAILPASVRQNFTIDFFNWTTQASTIVGTTVAIIGGLLIHRRLSDLPGVKANYYLLLSFAASYGIVVLIFFLARFEYTRVTFVASFVITVFWFYLCNVAARRLRPTVLAVVPGGGVDTLAAIDDVTWVRLTTPSQPTKTWSGLVADLRADLPDAWVHFISEVAVSGTPVFHVKQVAESLTGRVEIEHLSENTLGSLNPNRAYLEVKQTIDWIVALVALVILSPLLVLVAILIRLDSPGPAFFLQMRRGYRGRDFRVFKFRSMRDAPAAAADGDALDSAITKDNDKRVTRIGRFIRRTRIDELPQLINVLRGEMSWIGPRPEAVVLSEWYDRELPFYTYRHVVRPGLTGWAQVNQGHVAAVTDVQLKLEYDFYYIKNFSFWLDFLIVLKTIRIIFTGYGAR